MAEIVQPAWLAFVNFSIPFSGELQKVNESKKMVDSFTGLLKSFTDNINGVSYINTAGGPKYIYEKDRAIKFFCNVTFGGIMAQMREHDVSWLGDGFNT